jgi:hypothetical protein
VKLALESLPVVTRATPNQIRDGLAFDAEKVLETGHAVITGCQCAPDGGESLESKRVLFAGIDHDDGLPIGQFAKRTKDREAEAHFRLRAAARLRCSLMRRRSASMRRNDARLLSFKIGRA